MWLSKDILRNHHQSTREEPKYKIENVLGGGGGWLKGFFGGINVYKCLSFVLLKNIGIFVNRTEKVWF